MLRLILAVAASCLLANGAAAQNPTRQAGDWFLRVGASIVDPKSGNLRIDENWCLNFELRWIDIDTDLEAKFSDGSKVGLGEVEIDPLLYGLNVGYRF